MAAVDGHDLSVFPDGLRGKRILLCTESFGPVNGVSRTTLMLVNHLRANGANVAVIAPHNHTKQNTFVPTVPPPENKKKKTPAVHGNGTQDGTGTGQDESTPLLDESAKENVEIRIHGYPLPYNPELSIVYPLRLSRLYERAFGAERPDLIYLASPASLGFQVMLQLRQQLLGKQIPVICNFQTDLAGYCAILFPPPLSYVAVYTFSMVQGFLFKHPSVKTIFYPSRFVRRYLESNGVQADKMEVLRRGVNTEMFCPTRRSPALRREIAPDGEIILVCVARLAGEKGFEFLARVAKELDKRGLKFKLYIVGGNRNAAVEAEVHDMFTDLRDQGKVIFAGFHVGEALATAYASADLFLHCSITETFGLVVLESMASGVPVVARDEGGPSDIVDDGVSGFLVPPDNLDGFVEKVMLLAENTEMRRQFSESARKQACEATWDKINNKVAWRMLDTIQARSRYQQELVAETKAKQDRRDAARAAWRPSLQLEISSVVTPVSQLVREEIVNLRILGGLSTIMAFWGAVSIYLIFIKVTMWTKGGSK